MKKGRTAAIALGLLAGAVPMHAGTGGRTASAARAVGTPRAGLASQLGELGGLQLAGGLKRLEVVPYGVAQVSTQPVEGGNPFEKSRDPGGAVGADLKYALTPGLTMTMTINPDFGQVEADPAVVNLTAFETFYPERRPFFVESSGNLRFDLDCHDGACTGLFYSRRIGRQPHGSPGVPAGGFASVPLQTTTIGAAKLTGRAGAFSIGALNAVTAEEQASLSFGARGAAARHSAPRPARTSGTASRPTAARR